MLDRSSERLEHHHAQVGRLRTKRGDRGHQAQTRCAIRMRGAEQAARVRVDGRLATDEVP